MKTKFANRIQNVPRSFIREILKVTSDKEVISFAGGLPNPLLFPTQEILEASQKVISISGMDAMQYSNSEGYYELRKDIAKKYKTKLNIDIPVEQILITTGSQQALDLLGKLFINEGDELLIEEPGYLGAIQAFSVYRPEFLSVPLDKDGMRADLLAGTLRKHNPKLMYTVPNFQNPSGISYSNQNRKAVADLIKNRNILLVEDDPYGELQFRGEPKQSFKTLVPDQTIMLGTFSKTVVPSFRIGWIVAPEYIMDKLIVLKQAADLHTNFFCQMVLHQYFDMFDNVAHIQKVSNAYGNQCEAMISAIEKYFPDNIQYTKPDGGMFLWVTLPQGFSSIQLLDKAMKKKVVFVPGDQFYTNLVTDANTLRLNFTCSNEETIDRGIRILAETIKLMVKEESKILYYTSSLV